LGCITSLKKKNKQKKKTKKLHENFGDIKNILVVSFLTIGPRKLEMFTYFNANWVLEILLCNWRMHVWTLSSMILFKIV